MNKEGGPMMWPLRKDVSWESLRTLQLDLPRSFIEQHQPLMATVARLLEQSRPIRVIEYGAGELPEPEARQISRLCTALADKTRGESWSVVFSSEAAARAGAGSEPSETRRTWVDGNALSASLTGGLCDLVIHHAVKARNETHPLHTFWSFIELQPAVADTSYWVFTECQPKGTERCEAVREYHEALGIRPLFWGTESVWESRRSAPSLSDVVRSTGALPPLSADLRMDPGSFLRIYDQVFAPLLGRRAGTFRLMLETVLARPGPYVIIETGTTRESGDIASNGQSTVLFDLLVNCFGGRVITIDIDPTNIRYCRGRTSARTTLLCADSVKALLALPEVGQADLIYLDSYDFDERNPHPSSMHHMKELAAVWGRARSSCLLVIDDCFGPQHGKHAYVARFLESLGKGPYFMGYQTGWQL